jgi:DNA repair protein RadC
MNQIKNETAPEYTIQNFPENQDAKVFRKEEAIIKKAMGILEKRLKTYGAAFTRPETVKSHCIMKLRDLEIEHFNVMFLNSQHQLIEEITVAKGTIDGAAVYPREVSKLALQLNAKAVIFSHNHPSGTANPSEADRAITKRLKDGLSLFDILVLDHIIVGGVDTYAFSENGLI